MSCSGHCLLQGEVSLVKGEDYLSVDIRTMFIDPLKDYAGSVN